MTKLFVGGLPSDLEETELEEIFREFGSVISVNIVRDKRTKASRRYGFVDMGTREAADNAINLLHTGSIDGQEISVKLAVPDLKKSGGRERKVRKVALKNNQGKSSPGKRKRPRIGKG